MTLRTKTLLVIAIAAVLDAIAACRTCPAGTVAYHSGVFGGETVCARPPPDLDAGVVERESQSRPAVDREEPSK